MASQRSNRFTRDDIEIINEALALLEAEVEGDEPSPYGHDAEDVEAVRELAEWEQRLERIRHLRVKVHRRRS